MALNILQTATINGFRFRKTHTLVKSGLGKWKISNHSGLGNALKKAGFSQLAIKQVYAFFRG